MDVLDIIAIEGIVIRKIPATSISLTSYREGDLDKLKSNQKIIHRNNKIFIETMTHNSMGGKYLITKKMDQFSTVQFDRRYDGIGDTIESAYADYIEKNGA